MKKIITLVAAAALFAGCDSVEGYTGPPIQFNNVTVTELGGTFTTPVVEVQDIASRVYFSAPVTTGSPLGGFEITAGHRDLYVVLLDGTEFVGHGGAFRPMELTEDPTFEIRTSTGDVVGRVMLDVQ